MSRIDIAPTRSSLLTLTRQLGFAQEGFELLDQKRQILVIELMGRLERAVVLERRVVGGLEEAHAALTEAELDVGCAALDAVAIGVSESGGVRQGQRRLMGMGLSELAAEGRGAPAALGPMDSTMNADIAASRFDSLLPLLAELGELDDAIRRLALELRKTQRRCNALSKTFLPRYRETISYIQSTLEERERESFVMFKLIRDRLSRSGGEKPRR